MTGPKPRIISGTLGGRTIPGPPGKGTRPTSDRVREALFSRLDGWDALAGARVLDLYAGTGALALESLSRGAAHAVLVEVHGPTARQLRRTVADLGLSDRVDVRAGKARAVAAGLAGHGATLVFLDPPYDVSTDELEQLTDTVAAAVAKPRGGSAAALAGQADLLDQFGHEQAARAHTATSAGARTASRSASMLRN